VEICKHERAAPVARCSGTKVFINRGFYKVLNLPLITWYKLMLVQVYKEIVITFFVCEIARLALKRHQLMELGTKYPFHCHMVPNTMKFRFPDLMNPMNTQLITLLPRNCQGCSS